MFNRNEKIQIQKFLLAICIFAIATLVLFLSMGCDLSLFFGDKSLVTDVKPELTKCRFTSTANSNVPSDFKSVLNDKNTTFTFYLEPAYMKPDVDLVPEITGMYDKLYINGVEFTGKEKINCMYPKTVRAVYKKVERFYTIEFVSIDSIAINKFSFLKAENTFLARDYIGVIDANIIKVTLPFSVFESHGDNLVPHIEGLYTKVTPPYSSGVNFKNRTSFYIAGAEVNSPDKVYYVDVEGVRSSECDILSFKFEASKNTALARDYVAVVGDNKISVELPYEVLQNNTSLLPTIVCSDGSTLSPEGSQSFSSSVSYRVEAENGTSFKDYQVVVAVDPSTLVFYRGAEPFYLNGSTPVAITEAQGTVFTNDDEITISLDTAFFATVSGKKIGFNSVTVPFNTSYDVRVHGGVTPPFNTTVTSKDGNYSKDYVINIRRKASGAAGIVSISYSRKTIYSYTVTAYSNKSSFSSFWNSSSTLSSQTKNSSQANANRPGSLVSDSTKHTGGINDPKGIYNYNSSYRSAASSYYSTITGYSGGVTSSGFTYGSTSSGVFGNNATAISVSGSYGAPGNSTVSDSTTNYTFTTQHLKQYTLNMHQEEGCTYTYSKTFGFRQYSIRSYSAKPYYKYTQLKVRRPDFATFENIIPQGGIVASTTQDSVYLVFNLRDLGGSRQTGSVANFDIVSETGTRNSYSLSLN